MTVVSAAFVLTLAACTAGSGEIVTQSRSVGDFDRIEISSALDVELEIDPGAKTTVSVTYDDNLIDRVTTEVRGGTLMVDIDGNVSTFGGGRSVRITADSLEAIAVSGAVDLKGSGEVEAYHLTVSGSSDVDLRDLRANHISIDVSGASDVSIRASQSVTGNILGASDVTIHGDPASVVVDASGASDLHEAD